MARIRKSDKNNCWWGYREVRTFIRCWGSLWGSWSLLSGSLCAPRKPEALAGISPPPLACCPISTWSLPIPASLARESGAMCALKSSKRKTKCYLQRNPHMTISRIFSRNFAVQKGVAGYIQSAERKTLLTKTTSPSKVGKEFSRQAIADGIHHH